MVAVVNRLVPAPGREQELERVVSELGQKVRANEPGCVAFQFVRSRHEPGVYLLLERYADDEALTDHVNTAHYVEALPGLMDCLGRLPEIAIYDEVR